MNRDLDHIHISYPDQAGQRVQWVGHLATKSLIQSQELFGFSMPWTTYSCKSCVLVRTYHVLFLVIVHFASGLLSLGLLPQLLGDVLHREEGVAARRQLLQIIVYELVLFLGE